MEVNTHKSEKASVLVVDDNPLVVNVLKGLFASEDYQVFSCTNGAEAIEFLDKKNVDVIVCDVMMPKMGGYELHESVRKSPEHSHIPFIFLTALSDRKEVQRGRESGADDYFVKPFDPRELLATVKGKVVRSRQLREASQDRYDAFRKRIIHTLSHEFRTPLVAINTGTELLLGQQNSIAEQKVQNLLQAIQRGGQRLEKLVNDFMLMQQIEAGVAQRLFETRAKVISFKTFVLAYLETRRESLEEQGFVVRFVDNCDEGNICCYEPQIHNIFDRIIDNVIKFSPERLELEVVFYREESFYVVEFRDRGLGFNVDQVKEAIDVFGQIDRDKLEQQGGGLGLAIVNRYASIHGGSIELENRPDGGSVVCLRLPVSR